MIAVLMVMMMMIQQRRSTHRLLNNSFPNLLQFLHTFMSALTGHVHNLRRMTLSEQLQNLQSGIGDLSGVNGHMELFRGLQTLNEL
jgi:hypothetical protein